MFSKILSMQFMQLPIRRSTYMKVVFGCVAGAILSPLLLILLLFCLSGGIAIVLPYWSGLIYITISLIGLFGIFIAYAFGALLFFVMRRLQTLGYSTYWMLLILFPILFIILVFVLMSPEDEKIAPVKEVLLPNRKQSSSLLPPSPRLNGRKVINFGIFNKIRTFFQKYYKVTFIILAVAGLFYWFQWRPMEIRERCAMPVLYTDPIPALTQNDINTAIAEYNQCTASIQDFLSSPCIITSPNGEVGTHLLTATPHPAIPAEPYFVQATPAEYEACLHRNGI